VHRVIVARVLFRDGKEDRRYKRGLAISKVGHLMCVLGFGTHGKLDVWFEKEGKSVNGL
jgi:hypothetical protein